MASPLPLSGKVALVTGSSRSIGAAIATSLAEDGAKVVINYVSNSTAAHDVVSTINAKHPDSAISIQADVSTISGGQILLHQTLSHFGKLDILILNAAIMGSKRLAEIDEKYYDDHMNCNVKGQLFLVQAAAPHLTSGSRIIFLSSSLTKLSTVLPEALVYIATKGAIEQITRALAKDLGARGITVNTVSPGPTDTDLFREGKSESHINFIASLIPSKQLGRPEEIAPLVSFLSSPKAQHVNGQTILVNGVSGTLSRLRDGMDDANVLCRDIFCRIGTRESGPVEVSRESRDPCPIAVQRTRKKCVVDAQKNVFVTLGA